VTTIAIHYDHLINMTSSSQSTITESEWRLNGQCTTCSLHRRVLGMEDWMIMT